MRYRDTALPLLLPVVLIALVSACAADVDTVLAQNPSLVLAAHDSAHVRTLVIEPSPGLTIDSAFVPVLLLESGARLEFTTSVVPTLADSLALLPNVRVNLTPPVNGTLRLRICTPDSDSTALTDSTPTAGERNSCRTLSMPVETRGRTLRGQSSSS